MSETLSIPILNMVLFLSVILVPAGILHLRKSNLGKELIIGVIRMAVQLTFIGVYLQFLFEKNNPFFNILWVLIMVVIANMTIIKRAGLKRRFLFWASGVGLLASISVVGVLLLLTVGVKPIYDAPYLIPMIGMLMGNALQGNVISLERFYSSLKSDRDIYELMLFNGSSKLEALTPFINRSLSAAVSPAVAGMMTMGLVSLPGMMTGQILGGTVPIEAIKYQIVIMGAIFLTLFFSVFFNLICTPLVTFTPYGILKSNIFRD